ncbi:MAG: 3-deoxy-7-phosphoheptulonate synthase [Pseudobdellovibrionaceae bacterium]|nr:3-deoxy-7-phosphoheptulonate synthase [Bdellovibrionales bacterium]USN46557.1 MAG: 3-deoxy-7-phosphoheptulonate synthase [Pseudobdellovibrionaceae bacterium]
MSTKTVQVGRFEIGGPNFVVIAGPCSVESKDQFLTTAEAVKSAGALMLRGGIFKLRTKPDTFQGLGSEAFALVKEVKHQTQMPFFSEITDPRQVGDLMDVVDVFQVGSRNMHNYALLKELGQVDKPVLLKRGFSGRIDEWIHAAEYVSSSGNPQVILCERGIRTFETKTRNTFDVNAIAYVKQHTSLPVIADPSHATGRSELVTPVALAAAAAGADGLIVEVHPNPPSALSDGEQALDFQSFSQLMSRLEKVLIALDRRLAPSW